MMPSPSDLTYFLEAASSLNFSRAAERLGISQPSLTLAIQRLENELNSELFFRSNKGVVLSPAGKQLFGHARELLQKWDLVKGQVLASTREVQGHYSVGCHVSVGLYALPRALASLMKKYPRLELKLVHDLSRKITERVIAMEVDLALAVNPVRHPDLVIRKLLEDEVTLWSGTRKNPNQDLHSGEAVLIGDLDLVQTQDVLRKLKKKGVEFRRVISTSSLELITELTAEGAGIGILPGRVAARSLQPLKKIAQAPVFHDEICLLYRVENRGVKAIQAITEELLGCQAPFLRPGGR